MRPDTEEKAREAIKLVHDSSGDYELHAPTGWHFNEYVNGTVSHGAKDSYDHITFHSTKEVALHCKENTPLILCQDDCAHCNENEEMEEEENEQSFYPHDDNESCVYREMLLKLCNDANTVLWGDAAIALAGHEKEVTLLSVEVLNEAKKLLGLDKV